MRCITSKQFWNNAVVQAIIVGVIAPVLVYVLHALAAMWAGGTFHGDYMTILASASSMLALLAAQVLSRYFPVGGKADPNSGSFLS
ncbi:MAG: hypothetical protein P4L93_11730 [Coriobacteriia bacterium]|nr:hypothetical protein [Coriobacteriia bacterium]